MDNLSKQLDFIVELDQLKRVYRQSTVKSDNNRFENSAEHSWHISLAAQILQEYTIESINISRVVSMLLIHDIVEIDAGDLFAFANVTALDEQQEKELSAAKRIFSLLPEKQYQTYKSLWLEFENTKTSEAKFAKAIDCLLPLIQNMNNEGGSWVKHKVKKSQVLLRNKHLKELTPKLWDYVCQQIDLAIKQGWLINDI